MPVAPYFKFVQFEFTHALGPPAGRYVVAPDAPLSVDEQQAPARGDAAIGATLGFAVADVLVVAVVGAQPSRLRVRRRAREVPAGATPVEVPLQLMTFIRGTEPLPDKHDARAWLEAASDSDKECHRWISDGLTVLNRAITGYRTGAHDPYAVGVTERDARGIRLGYGTTEEAGESRWSAAVELPTTPGGRSSRVDRLRPSEAVAGVLSGRSVPLEAEELLLRTLLDLDSGRTRAAAHQLAAAMALLPAELAAQGADPRTPAALRSLAEDCAQLAETATEGPLDQRALAQLDHALEVAERAIDSWRFQLDAR